MSNEIPTLLNDTLLIFFIKLWFYRLKIVLFYLKRATYHHHPKNHIPITIRYGIWRRKGKPNKNDATTDTKFEKEKAVVDCRETRASCELSKSERRNRRYMNFKATNNSFLDKRSEIMTGSASILVQQIKKGNQLFKKGFIMSFTAYFNI